MSHNNSTTMKKASTAKLPHKLSETLWNGFLNALAKKSYSISPTSEQAALLLDITDDMAVTNIESDSEENNIQHHSSANSSWTSALSGCPSVDVTLRRGTASKNTKTNATQAEVVVLSSDSENENDNSIWSNKKKANYYQQLWEQTRYLVFHRLIPGYAWTRIKCSSSSLQSAARISMIDDESSLFPYGKLQAFNDSLKKFITEYALNSKEMHFVWQSVIQWLIAIKVSTDPLDLDCDEKFNLILVDLMVQYVNYKLHLHAHLIDNEEILAKVNQITQTLSVIFNGNNTHTLMVLLRIELKHEYRNLLDPIFRKHLTDRSLSFISDDFIVYLRLILCFKRWKLITPLKSDREKINEIAFGKANDNSTIQQRADRPKTLTDTTAIEQRIEYILPKAVPKLNIQNQSFVSISDLIGYAIERKANGTRILLMNSSIDLDEAIQKYFRLYEKYITRKTTGIVVASQQQSSICRRLHRIGNFASCSLEVLDKCLHRINTPGHAVQQPLQSSTQRLQRRDEEMVSSRTHLGGLICDNNNKLSNNSNKSNHKLQSDINLSKQNNNTKVIELDTTDDEKSDDQSSFDKNVPDRVIIQKQKTQQQQNSTQTRNRTDIDSNPSQNSFENTRNPNDTSIQTDIDLPAKNDRDDKKVEQNLPAEKENNSVRIASEIENQKVQTPEATNQKTDTNSPSCRIVLDNATIMPQRKNEQCILGEVSSTTSMDNVGEEQDPRLENKNSNQINNITKSKNSDLLEVHSAGSYGNAREVGTVKVFDQRMSQSQKLLANDTHTPEDDDDEWSSLVVVEEATSSTEVFSRAFSAEKVIFSKPLIKIPIRLNEVVTKKDAENEKASHSANTLPLESDKAIQSKFLQTDLPTCSRYITNTENKHSEPNLHCSDNNKLIQSPLGSNQNDASLANIKPPSNNVAVYPDKIVVIDKNRSNKSNSKDTNDDTNKDCKKIEGNVSKPKTDLILLKPSKDLAIDRNKTASNGGICQDVQKVIKDQINEAKSACSDEISNCNNKAVTLSSNTSTVVKEHEGEKTEQLNKPKIVITHSVKSRKNSHAESSNNYRKSELNPLKADDILSCHSVQIQEQKTQTIDLLNNLKNVTSVIKSSPQPHKNDETNNLKTAASDQNFCKPQIAINPPKIHYSAEISRLSSHDKIIPLKICQEQKLNVLDTVKTATSFKSSNDQKTDEKSRTEKTSTCRKSQAIIIPSAILKIYPDQKNKITELNKPKSVISNEPSICQNSQTVKYKKILVINQFKANIKDQLNKPKSDCLPDTSKFHRLVIPQLCQAQKPNRLNEGQIVNSENTAAGDNSDFKIISKVRQVQKIDKLNESNKVSSNNNNFQPIMVYNSRDLAINNIKPSKHSENVIYKDVSNAKIVQSILPSPNILNIHQDQKIKASNQLIASKYVIVSNSSICNDSKTITLPITTMTNNQEQNATNQFTSSNINIIPEAMELVSSNLKKINENQTIAISVTEREKDINDVVDQSQLKLNTEKISSISINPTNLNNNDEVLITDDNAKNTEVQANTFEMPQKTALNVVEMLETDSEMLKNNLPVAIESSLSPQFKKDTSVDSNSEIGVDKLLFVTPSANSQEHADNCVEVSKVACNEIVNEEQQQNIESVPKGSAIDLSTHSKENPELTEFDESNLRTSNVNHFVEENNSTLIKNINNNNDSYCFEKNERTTITNAEIQVHELTTKRDDNTIALNSIAKFSEFPVKTCDIPSCEITIGQDVGIKNTCEINQLNNVIQCTQEDAGSVLSKEDIEKRTPWKMRIKRRISQCADINKEFSLTDRCSSETLVHGVPINEKTIEEKNDIKKSLDAIICQSLEEKSSCNLETNDEKLIADCDENNTAMTPKSGRRKKQKSKKISFVTDNISSPNVEIQQTNEINTALLPSEPAECLQQRNETLNYNTEEILAVAALMNMQKNSTENIEKVINIPITTDEPEKELNNGESKKLKSALKTKGATNTIKRKVNFDLSNIIITEKINDSSNKSRAKLRTKPEYINKSGNNYVRKRLQELYEQQVTERKNVVVITATHNDHPYTRQYEKKTRTEIETIFPVRLTAIKRNISPDKNHETTILPDKHLTKCSDIEILGNIKNSDQQQQNVKRININGTRIKLKSPCQNKNAQKIKNSKTQTTKNKTAKPVTKEVCVKVKRMKFSSASTSNDNSTSINKEEKEVNILPVPAGDIANKPIMKQNITTNNIRPEAITNENNMQKSDKFSTNGNPSNSNIKEIILQPNDVILTEEIVSNEVEVQKSVEAQCRSSTCSEEKRSPKNVEKQVELISKENACDNSELLSHSEEKCNVIKKLTVNDKSQSLTPLSKFDEPIFENVKDIIMSRPIITDDIVINQGKEQKEVVPAALNKSSIQRRGKRRATTANTAVIGKHEEIKNNKSMGDNCVLMSDAEKKENVTKKSTDSDSTQTPTSLDKGKKSLIEEKSSIHVENNIITSLLTSNSIDNQVEQQKDAKVIAEFNPDICREVAQSMKKYQKDVEFETQEVNETNNKETESFIGTHKTKTNTPTSLNECEELIQQQHISNISKEIILQPVELKVTEYIINTEVEEPKAVTESFAITHGEDQWNNKELENVVQNKNKEKEDVDQMRSNENTSDNCISNNDEEKSESVNVKTSVSNNSVAECNSLYHDQKRTAGNDGGGSKNVIDKHSVSYRTETDAPLNKCDEQLIQEQPISSINKEIISQPVELMENGDVVNNQVEEQEHFEAVTESTPIMCHEDQRSKTELENDVQIGNQDVDEIKSESRNDNCEGITTDYKKCENIVEQTLVTDSTLLNECDEPIIKEQPIPSISQPIEMLTDDTGNNDLEHIKSVTESIALCREEQRNEKKLDDDVQVENKEEECVKVSSNENTSSNCGLISNNNEMCENIIETTLVSVTQTTLNKCETLLIGEHLNEKVNEEIASRSMVTDNIVINQTKEIEVGEEVKVLGEVEVAKEIAIVKKVGVATQSKPGICRKRRRKARKIKKIVKNGKQEKVKNEKCESRNCIVTSYDNEKSQNVIEESLNSVRIQTPTPVDKCKQRFIEEYSSINDSQVIILQPTKVMIIENIVDNQIEEQKEITPTAECIPITCLEGQRNEKALDNNVEINNQGEEFDKIRSNKNMSDNRGLISDDCESCENVIEKASVSDRTTPTILDDSENPFIGQQPVENISRPIEEMLTENVVNNEMEKKKDIEAVAECIPIMCREEPQTKQNKMEVDNNEEIGNQLNVAEVWSNENTTVNCGLFSNNDLNCENTNEETSVRNSTQTHLTEPCIDEQPIENISQPIEKMMITENVVNNEIEEQKEVEAIVESIPIICREEQQIKTELDNNDKFGNKKDVAEIASSENTITNCELISKSAEKCKNIVEKSSVSESTLTATINVKKDLFVEEQPIENNTQPIVEMLSENIVNSEMEKKRAVEAVAECIPSVCDEENQTQQNQMKLDNDVQSGKQTDNFDNTNEENTSDNCVLSNEEENDRNDVNEPSVSGVQCSPIIICEEERRETEFKKDLQIGKHETLIDTAINENVSDDCAMISNDDEKDENIEESSANDSAQTPTLVDECEEPFIEKGPIEKISQPNEEMLTENVVNNEMEEQKEVEAIIESIQTVTREEKQTQSNEIELDNDEQFGKQEESVVNKNEENTSDNDASGLDEENDENVVNDKPSVIGSSAAECSPIIICEEDRSETEFENDLQIEKHENLMETAINENASDDCAMISNDDEKGENIEESSANDSAQTPTLVDECEEPFIEKEPIEKISQPNEEMLTENVNNEMEEQKEVEAIIESIPTVTREEKQTQSNEIELDNDEQFGKQEESVVNKNEENTSDNDASGLDEENDENVVNVKPSVIGSSAAECSPIIICEEDRSETEFENDLQIGKHENLMETAINENASDDCAMISNDDEKGENIEESSANDSAQTPTLVDECEEPFIEKEPIEKISQPNEEMLTENIVNNKMEEQKDIEGIIESIPTVTREEKQTQSNEIELDNDVQIGKQEESVVNKNEENTSDNCAFGLDEGNDENVVNDKPSVIDSSAAECSPIIICEEDRSETEFENDLQIGKNENLMETAINENASDDCAMISNDDEKGENIDASTANDGAQTLTHVDECEEPFTEEESTENILRPIEKMPTKDIVSNKAEEQKDIETGVKIGVQEKQDNKIKPADKSDENIINVVVAELKLLSPEHTQRQKNIHYDQGEPNKEEDDESDKHEQDESDKQEQGEPDKQEQGEPIKQAQNATSTVHLKNNHNQQKLYQDLESAIEQVLGNSISVKNGNSKSTTISEISKITTSNKLLESINEKYHHSPRIDILTAEEINSSYEQFHNITTSTETTDFDTKARLSEKFKKKTQLNDMKKVPDDLPDVLFADEESENSNSEDITIISENIPMVSDEILSLGFETLQNYPPIINTIDIETTDSTKMQQECLSLPTFVKVEEKSPTNRKTERLSETNDGKPDVLSRCNSGDLCQSFKETTTVDFPYGYTFDDMLIDQYEQSIGGTTGKECKSMKNIENVPIANSELIVGDTQTECVESNNTMGEGIFLPLNGFVEVENAIPFNLEQDFWEDSGNFFTFPELDKTQSSRSNSFSNDSDSGTDRLDTHSDHVTVEKRDNCVAQSKISAVFDHSYNKDITDIEKNNNSSSSNSSSSSTGKYQSSNISEMTTTDHPQNLTSKSPIKDTSTSPSATTTQKVSPIINSTPPKLKSYGTPYWKIKNTDTKKPEVPKTQSPSKASDTTFDYAIKDHSTHINETGATTIDCLTIAIDKNKSMYDMPELITHSPILNKKPLTSAKDNQNILVSPTVTTVENLKTDLIYSENNIDVQEEQVIDDNIATDTTLATTVTVSTTISPSSSFQQIIRIQSQTNRLERVETTDVNQKLETIEDDAKITTKSLTSTSPITSTPVTISKTIATEKEEIALHQIRESTPTLDEPSEKSHSKCKRPAEVIELTEPPAKRSLLEQNNLADTLSKNEVCKKIKIEIKHHYEKTMPGATMSDNKSNNDKPDKATQDKDKNEANRDHETNHPRQTNLKNQTSPNDTITKKPTDESIERKIVIEAKDEVTPKPSKQQQPIASRSYLINDSKITRIPSESKNGTKEYSSGSKSKLQVMKCLTADRNMLTTTQTSLRSNTLDKRETLEVSPSRHSSKNTHSSSPHSSKTTHSSSPHPSKSTRSSSPHSSTSTRSSSPHTSKSTRSSSPHASKSTRSSSPHASKSTRSSSPHENECTGRFQLATKRSSLRSNAFEKNGLHTMDMSPKTSSKQSLRSARSSSPHENEPTDRYQQISKRPSLRSNTFSRNDAHTMEMSLQSSSTHSLKTTRSSSPYGSESTGHYQPTTKRPLLRSNAVGKSDGYEMDMSPQSLSNHSSKITRSSSPHDNQVASKRPALRSNTVSKVDTLAMEMSSSSMHSSKIARTSSPHDSEPTRGYQSTSKRSSLRSNAVGRADTHTMEMSLQSSRTTRSSSPYVSETTGRYQPTTNRPSLRSNGLGRSDAHTMEMSSSTHSSKTTRSSSPHENEPTGHYQQSTKRPLLRSNAVGRNDAHTFDMSPQPSKIARSSSPHDSDPTSRYQPYPKVPENSPKNSNNPNRNNRHYKPHVSTPTNASTMSPLAAKSNEAAMNYSKTNLGKKSSEPHSGSRSTHQQQQQSFNSSSPSALSIDVANIRLPEPIERYIAQCLEAFRATLPIANTFVVHRENKRKLLLQEEKLRLKCWEEETRIQKQRLIEKANQLERVSNAAATSRDRDATGRDRTEQNPIAANNSRQSEHNHPNLRHHDQQSQPQQQQPKPQLQKYVNKFGEIDKQVNLNNHHNKETRNSIAHNDSSARNQKAPLTIPTAWEPKPASVDEIIEHLSKRRRK